MNELLPVFTIPITEQVLRGCIPRESIHDLLACPGGCRRFGHIDMNYLPSLLAYNKENEEYTESCGRNGEEIYGDDIFSVIRQECPPALGRRLVMVYHVFRDGCLADLDAELEQLSMNSRRTP